MLDWLLHPLALYSFVVVVAALNLGLFWSLKLEAARSAFESRRRVRELEAAQDELRRHISSLEKKASREPEILVAPAAIPEVPAGDLNLTRRSQALRLARRGETPERIAAALGIPQNEVDLLLKVQEIITGTVEKA